MPAWITQESSADSDAGEVVTYSSILPSVVPWRRQSRLALADDANKSKKQDQFNFFFPRCIGEVEAFALSENNTLDQLKRVAKHLGLRITTTCRAGRNDRISFSVKRRVVRTLKAENVVVVENLFKFGMRVRTGFFQPSTLQQLALLCLFTRHGHVCRR